APPPAPPPDAQGQLPPGGRHRRARDPPRRDGQRPPRPARRRPAGHRRYGRGGDRARRALRRPGGRLRLPDRTELSRRPGAAGAPRGSRAHRVLTAEAVGTRDHGGERGAVRTGLAVSSVLFVAERGGGWLTNSLALLTDAAHMFTDVAALALTLFALWIAGRPASDSTTFGYAPAARLAPPQNAIV